MRSENLSLGISVILRLCPNTLPKLFPFGKLKKPLNKENKDSVETFSLDS